MINKNKSKKKFKLRGRADPNKPIVHLIFFCMARGELDRPDPALIIEGSRRSHPSKRVQGKDYPILVSEEVRHRAKGTHHGKS